MLSLQSSKIRRTLQYLILIPITHHSYPFNKCSHFSKTKESLGLRQSVEKSGRFSLFWLEELGDLSMYHRIIPWNIPSLWCHLLYSLFSQSAHGMLGTNSMHCTPPRMLCFLYSVSNFLLLGLHIPALPSLSCHSEFRPL